MIRLRRKRSMRTIITFLIVVGNAIGACLTYLYFSHIVEIHQAQQALPFYYTDLFFGIATAILIFSFVGMMRRSFLPLYQIANGEVSIEGMDHANAQILKKRAMQLPSAMAGVSFLVWILAGFIFGLLQPVITQIIFGIKADLIECLKQFFGITCIGGSITTLFIYFYQALFPRVFPCLWITSNVP